MTTARAYFQKGCAANHATSCFNMGILYDQGLGVEKNQAQALMFYEKACLFNDAQVVLMPQPYIP